MEENNTLLEVRDLQQYFPVAGRRGAFVRAVDGVSFTVREGETFGLVGESGCGKSTLARTVIRLYQPTGGSVSFDGLDITGLSQQELKRSGFRRRMQMVFQDPYSSLNGRMTIRDALLEPLIANRIGESARERDEMARAALARVNLAPDCLHRYPHEFSGGQRQRVCIARALIVRPRMVICDEAISALDVSIQAQVVNMLGDFQQELGLTYLFIAHDLSMVRYVSHRVGVMYLGRLVELCESEEIYSHPLHPLHPGAAALGAGTGPEACAEPGQGGPGGRGAQSHRPARRVPFPPPVSLRQAHLPGGRPRHGGRRRRTYGGLPPV